METNISGLSTNGIVGNYASDYISLAFSYPSNTIGGIALTSRHSGIRGLGAGVQVFGNTLGGSIGKGVYDSILNNGLSTKSIGQGFSTGFKNAFDFKGGWTSAGAGLGMNAAGAILSAVGGPKLEYSGEKGSVTKGLDTAYDVATTVAGAIPGVGTLVSGLMSLNKGLTGVLNKWGGGTDAMTDVDAVLGSNWFGPIGSVNGFTGKKAHTMDGKDFMTQEQLGNMWAGYGDTYYNYQDALTKEGKKYGGLSSGARRRANRIIDKANMDKEYLLDMNRGYELGNIRGNNMSGINSTAYNIALSGGFKPISIGRLGFKISSLKEAINSIDRTPKSSTIIPWQPTEEEIEMFLKGGKPKLNSKETGEDPVGYSENGTPLYRKGDRTIGPSNGEDNLFELIKNSNANWAKRLQDPNRKYITYPDGSIGNFKLAWSEDETGTIVYPEIQEIDGQLVDLSGDPEKAWRSAIEHKDYIYFPSNEAADWFTKNYKNYYKGFNKTPLAFKQGGQMNVIPEGSLHARLHHMEDADGLTKKGIPVVDNEGNLLAEIELNEIIFRKEITDKLEELAKDGSNKAAEEAGRLLVEEIFENTDDRTGLIKDVTGEVEKNAFGGTFKLRNYSTLLEGESAYLKAIEEEAAKKIAESGEKAMTARGFLNQLDKGIKTITDTFSLMGTELKNKELQRKANIDLQLADAKQRELERLAIKWTIKALEELDNLDKQRLYAQNHLMAQEGDKIPTLEEFKLQKRLEIINAAIQKAITRKSPYKLKGNLMNCIATALNNYYEVPPVWSNQMFAENPEKYGFKELEFGDTVDTLPEGVLILDYNKPKNPNVPGHTVMLVSNKEGEKPLYSYSSGKNVDSDMHNQVEYGFYRWDNKTKPRAYTFVGNPDQQGAWEKEYYSLYPKFEEGGVLLQDVISLLLSLPPEKLKELLNILNYLNNG